MLQRIVEGDERAFAIFYRHYYMELEPISWRCLESGIEPSEVLQMAFTKMWLNREKLLDIENLKAWVVKIAYREYLMAVRKKISDETRLKKYSADSQEESSPVTPFHVANYNEMKACIRQVIQSLSPQRKAVYQMSREEGLKIDEIAKRLSISPNTVKSVLQTVLKLIKEKLITEGFGPFAFLFFCNFLIIE